MIWSKLLPVLEKFDSIKLAIYSIYNSYRLQVKNTRIPGWLACAAMMINGLSPGFVPEQPISLARLTISN